MDNTAEASQDTAPPQRRINHQLEETDVFTISPDYFGSFPDLLANLRLREGNAARAHARVRS